MLTYTLIHILYHVRKSSKMYQENLLNNDLNLASFCYVYCATQHITTIITTRNSDFICQLILKSKIFIKMFSKEQKIWIVENNFLSSTDLRRKFITHFRITNKKSVPQRNKFQRVIDKFKKEGSILDQRYKNHRPALSKDKVK